MTKKDKRFTPRPDARRPDKAGPGEAGEPVAVEGPSYDGPEKSDRVPEQKGKAKAELAKDDVRRPRPPKDEPDFPEMKPPRRRTGRGGNPPEQYVRLRVRVRGDQMSVVDSHLVDGPLSQDKAFPGTNAYEVTLGDRLLNAGALPDLGTQRSFVDPNGPDEQQTHHITEREVFEFTARVPAAELSPDTIGEVAVRLHRVKGEARADVLTGERLDKQFERQMRPVAEMRGLPPSALPEEIERRRGHTPRLST